MATTRLFAFIGKRDPVDIAHFTPDDKLIINLVTRGNSPEGHRDKLLSGRIFGQYDDY